MLADGKFYRLILRNSSIDQVFTCFRIRQDRSFIKGIKIELGAEILHGSDTVLTQLAHKHNWSLQEIYCWAHGDGGPGKHPVNGGYGLYYFQDGQKLLRYDEQQDQEFIYTNDTIWVRIDRLSVAMRRSNVVWIDRTSVPRMTPT